MQTAAFLSPYLSPCLSPPVLTTPSIPLSLTPYLSLFTALRQHVSRLQFYKPRQGIAINVYSWKSMLTTQRVTHARPAVKLVRQFYPTKYSRNTKRRLHRPLLSIMAEEKFWSLVSCPSWMRSTGGSASRERKRGGGDRQRTTPFNKVSD